MDFSSTIWGFIFTAVIYIAFPLIKIFINGGRFCKEEAHKIALWNSIVLGVLFCVATAIVSEGGTVWSCTPAILYYWINRAILTDKNIPVSDKFSTIEDSDKIKKKKRINKQNTPENFSRICLSKHNEQPKENSNFNISGKDLRLIASQETESFSKNGEFESEVFPSFEIFAYNLAKMCSKEIIDITSICSNKQVEFDERKLSVSTFAYFYAIKLFCYGNISNEQENHIREIYKKQFSEFNRIAFEGEAYKNAIDNESEFDTLLFNLLNRQKKDFYQQIPMVNGGISDEYISQFVVNEEDKSRIKADIAIKILKEWAIINNKTQQVRYCRNCGEKLNEGSKFCSQCGTKVAKE